MPSPGDWTTPPNIITLPAFMDPQGPGIIIGQSAADGTVYPELAALYAPGVVVGAIIQQEDRFDYVYLAYVNPTVGRSFWAVGAIEGVSLTLREAFRVAPGALGAVPDFEVRARLRLITTGQAFDFDIDGVSQGRGIASSPTNTIAASPGITVETVIQTTGATRYRAGRAYRFPFSLEVNSNVAGDFAVFTFRRTNLAGAMRGNQMGYLTAPLALFGTFEASKVFVNYTGVDIVDSIVLTVFSFTGNVVTVAANAQLIPEDIGNATNFVTFPQI